MIEVPLRSISISDFRRLAGHRTLPLDAPIVLLHGPNGTGKTSVLAALEMGLTGQIRSMRRHDPRYTAYLPHVGQDFATIRVELAAQYAANQNAGPLTVGGARIEGLRALAPDAAAFFAERCYLDQASLGQLLELYQYREGKEESALARFVNELLGLEQLDALRTGLHDSTNLRLLKNLAPSLDNAADEATRAEESLATQTAALQEIGTELVQGRTALLSVLREFDMGSDDDDDDALTRLADLVLRSRLQEADRAIEVDTYQQLVALSGRVAALAERPSTARLDDAKQALEAAQTAFDVWRAQEESAVLAVEQEVASLRPDVSGGQLRVVDAELDAAERELERQAELARALAAAKGHSADAAVALAALDGQLARAQEQAGTLVEGLAAIRAQIPDDTNICPVCDRDYSEVSNGHLGAHIDSKLADLTSHGERLIALREARDAAQARQFKDDQAVAMYESELFPAEQRGQFEERRSSLTELRQRIIDLQPSIGRGRELRAHLSDAEDLVARLEEAASESEFISHQLTRFSNVLSTLDQEKVSLDQRLKALKDVAAERVEGVESRMRQERDVEVRLTQFQELQRRLTHSTQTVAEAAQHKQYWDRRVQEARRRQAVARDVHHAAEVARTEVVQHVFTESLNQVWRSLFARLAPREQFVPSFGIPTASKTALELTLQTTQPNGETAGSPQMMLSAGNLNTAALSLFLALHLAVDSVVPCLVFDDPVQAMDEVHVAQFAGLMRVLSKQHARQVVIAVHERELFDYLALELSPAYEGDELITIELNDGIEGQMERVTRHPWTPDLAIAT